MKTVDERVRNGGAAGAAAFLILVVVGIVFPGAAEKIPMGVEAALTTVLATLVAYFVRRTPGKEPT